MYALPTHRPQRIRRLACALIAALAATGELKAQTPGPGGTAFWVQPNNGSWFEFQRWSGNPPWPGGVPISEVTAHIAYPITVEVLGQGQVGNCHHLSIVDPDVTLRIVGVSSTGMLSVHGTQIDNQGTILVGDSGALRSSILAINSHMYINGPGRIALVSPAALPG